MSKTSNGNGHEHVYKKRRLLKTLPDGRQVVIENCWRCGFGKVSVIDGRAKAAANSGRGRTK